MKESGIYCQWEPGIRTGSYWSGVSLHGHTWESKERLATLPYFIAQVPVISTWASRCQARYEKESGELFDFSRLYWTSPVSPHCAYQLEAGQIQHELNLEALVSTTDHDDIRAPLSLRRWNASPATVPISFEWTVPVDPCLLHLGVHNLPSGRAETLFRELTEYTRLPLRSKLRGLLEWLHSDPRILVVLNHPFWNQTTLPDPVHEQVLRDFWAEYSSYIHALELNGTRSWHENRRVRGLGQEWMRPLISGGDRHGFEPAAIINLTHAGTFSEFVSEIREAGRSDVLFMNHYRDSMRRRKLETMMECLRSHVHLPRGRKDWHERIFFEREDGDRPLSHYLERSPYLGPVHFFSRAIRRLDGRRRLDLLARMLPSEESGEYRPEWVPMEMPAAPVWLGSSTEAAA